MAPQRMQLENTRNLYLVEESKVIGWEIIDGPGLRVMTGKKEEEEEGFERGHRTRESKESRVKRN